jgi:adenylate cyclase
MSKRALPRVIIELVVILLFLLHVSTAVRLPLIEYLENFAYDARVTFTMPNTVSDDVIIADIDEKSLEALGHWPWNRDKLAELVDVLFEYYEINVIGFDVVFAEKDETGGLDFLQGLAEGEFKDDAKFQKAYKRYASQLMYDEQFAKSLENRNVVLGVVFEKDDIQVNQAPKVLGEFDAELVKRFSIPHMRGYIANTNVLSEKALTSGYFNNASLDSDGVSRRVPVLQEYNGQLFPSLALETTRVALGSPEVQFGIRDHGGALAVQDFYLGDVHVPLDLNANVLIPYRGEGYSFPYISVIDLINKKTPKDQMVGRVVLLGTSASGLLDLRATPVGNVYPGVEVHANIISGILNQSIRNLPDYTSGLQVVTIVFLGLLMVLLQPRLSPGWNIFLLLGLIMLLGSINMYFWNVGVVLPLASELLLIVWLFLIHMSYGYLFEFRGKKQMTKQFGQYVPPEIVGELSNNPDEISFEGQAKELTVLFSDVRGFTSISEGLDARELADLMNQYLTPMTKIIHEKRGTIDKYMGDAIMAFWGAPLDEPKHALLAMEASMDMLFGLKKMNEEFEARGWPEVKVGIGLNTGTMSVGNMGSDFRMAYTVMGDAVNLGARLESLTKQYGVSMIVSEYTAAAVPEYAYIELDRVTVKGKLEPVTIFQPLCKVEELSEVQKNMLAQYHKAINAYKNQDWEQAKVLFIELAAQDNNRMIYKIYLERISLFEKEPPPENWDGVFIHTNK